MCTKAILQTEEALQSVDINLCFISGSSNVHLSAVMNTARGNPLLVDNEGHRYRKHKLSKDKTIIFWICTKCKTRIHTDMSFNILNKKGEHTHAPVKVDIFDCMVSDS